MEYAVIMAGGLGTRLWPLSRQNVPKQLLAVSKGKSLLQLAFERLKGVVPTDHIYVCTAEAHRKAVLENLPELPEANLLGEPTGRDTANAVGFPAAVLHKKDADAVFAVVTADHVIEPIKQFQKCMRDAFDTIKAHPQKLVTFGIVPTHGHTGLGYVQKGDALDGHTGVFQVQAFKEKPDKPTADRYVESNRFYWNSGMFVWRADTVLEQLKTHLPEAHAHLAEIAKAWGSGEQKRVLEERYAKLPKISIDYAVLEPAGRAGAVVVVEMPIKWIDVGSYPALAETLAMDDHDNAIDAERLLMIDSDGNIIVSRDPEHLISTIGLSDMIVIHTKDVTMICPQSESQRVKELVGAVRAKFGEQYM